MKKIASLFACILCCLSLLHATTVTIKVADFSFKPKTVNVKVGDTVKWVWKTGIHTTTSVSIPVGAPAWDKPMDSAHKNFKYRLRVAGTYSYQCTYHFTVMKGTINVSSALAAGLNSFDIGGDGLNALLTWKTNSSSDISYFSVQRSTDGDNFREIGRVMPSASNSYNYADKEAKGKYVYYQVKMVDKKGASEYTGIEMKTRNVKDDKLIISMSPNPVTQPGHLMLEFSSDIEGSMRVQAYTQSGRLVKQADMAASKGINSGHFHMGDLQPGTYYLVFSLGNVTERHTVIVK